METNCRKMAHYHRAWIEYVDHELLVDRFHVTHHGRCTVLFNKDAFFSDVEVKSIYLHDTRRELPDEAMEGDSGWVLQAMLSRASFRRQRLSDQETFTVLSLHINTVYAKKRDVKKKVILTNRVIIHQENVDLVAVDFNGAAWLCVNRNNISTIEEAFADCAMPRPPGRTWIDSGQLGLTFVGSLNRMNPIGTGKYGFMVLSPYTVMYWACARPIKAATTTHGSTSTLSGGMTYSPNVRNMIKGSS